MTQGISTTKNCADQIRIKATAQRTSRRWLPAATFVAMATLPSAALADFLTSEPPFITLDSGVPAGSSVLAIISSGESPVGGFTFQGLPDG